MTSLLIRNVDPLLHARLKARAATQRHSLEEEARSLLRTGLARSETPDQPESLVALATRLFGPGHGTDLEIPARDPAQDRPPPDVAATA